MSTLLNEFLQSQMNGHQLCGRLYSPRRDHSALSSASHARRDNCFQLIIKHNTTCWRGFFRAPKQVPRGANWLYTCPTARTKSRKFVEPDQPLVNHVVTCIQVMRSLANASSGCAIFLTHRVSTTRRPCVRPDM